MYTGKTGNNTEASVESAGPQNRQVGFQFNVEVAGATPTVTWKIQGSLDNSTFYDVFYVTDSSDTAAATTIVSTAVGSKVIFLANQTSRMYRWFRVVTTSNTNITYGADMYLFASEF